MDKRRESVREIQLCLAEARDPEIRDGVVQFEPLCRGISYRHASAREIVRTWGKTGRRGPGPADEPDGDQPVAVPREQLSLPVAT